MTVVEVHKESAEFAASPRLHRAKNGKSNQRQVQKRAQKRPACLDLWFPQVDPVLYALFCPGTGVLGWVDLEPFKPEDRITVIAAKGEPVRISSYHSKNSGEP